MYVYDATPTFCQLSLLLKISIRRRSGLQDNLTASELRRLTDKLKKRGTMRDGQQGEMVIDYEK